VPDVATIVFFHAHPDDEAITTAGTMASLADAGHRVVLVTATRGELGEIPDGLLAPGQTLAEARQDELAEAARILGVHRLAYLDYLDSGMAGEDTNHRPGTFAAADVDEAAGRLAGILEEESADVLVTYDEHGGYGHPDHVQVHTVGVDAALRAGTPVVYYSTMNRDQVAGLMDQVRAMGGDWEPPEGSTDGMDDMGEPASRITTAVDVTPWIDRKRRAMQAHASQISDDSFFLSMPEALFPVVWGTEWYIRVRPLPETSGPGHWEPLLMVDGGPGPGGGAAVTGQAVLPT
jgi:LmbE family N-acetylglucosaminyl deacetylase